MDDEEVVRNDGDPMEILRVQQQARCEVFTRHRLQETLMLMGCRPKDAAEVTKECFAVFHKWVAASAPAVAAAPATAGVEPAALPWHQLHQCVYSVLARLDYTKPHHLLDLQIAKEITQHRQSFVVLLGGTSGTGKSTLASLLATRLRLPTVLPTDSIRHILRSYISREEHPCAFVSTYEAGNALPETVVQELSVATDGVMSAMRLHKRKVLRGYKLQSEVVLQKLDRVLTMFEERRQSLVVEGVHLNTDQMMELVKRHPNCVPFVVFISNEHKHLERFAVRARHMTIDPQENKYIKYFDNIRIIQRHLCKFADKYLIPKIDNTNVDRSIATIQSTLIRVLRKMDRGEKIFDEHINKMVLLSREHENSIKKAWSSKRMRHALRPLIKQKVSKRLLLRRLLAEQNMATFGSSHPHGDDDSSSDEEHQNDDEDKEESHNADDEAEDEDTTIVGSLLSATQGREHVSSMSQASGSRYKPSFLDDIEDHAAGDSESANMMRSLSAAIHQAARWKASQMLAGNTDWEAFALSRRADATFSDVVDNTHSAAQKWKADDRRRLWTEGEDDVKVRGVSEQGSKPPSDLGLPARHITFATSTSFESMEHSGPSTPVAACLPSEIRRARSAPNDALDMSAADYDFDSVSMAGHDMDDRVSLSSSRRDECISPLGQQSMDETDSHYEDDVSTDSSND